MAGTGRAAALAFALALAGAATVHAGGERDESVTFPVPQLHVTIFGRPGMILREILDGAIRRVSRPRCESLIGELNDVQGRPLAWNLSERNMSAVDYLAELRFLEGDGLRQCQSETTVAVTIPNSRVVFVCERRFARYFALRHSRGEAIIIHEFLHSLGLGENPPSSAEITALVERRCGD